MASKNARRNTIRASSIYKQSLGRSMMITKFNSYHSFNKHLWFLDSAIPFTNYSDFQFLKPLNA